MDYPPNSKMKSAPPEKKVERVTSVEATRRKKSLGKQFRETFVVGDTKSATRYVVFSVLIPAAKEAMVDAGRDWIERLVFGESHGKRRGPPSGATGYVSYNRMGTNANSAPPERSMSKRARSHHDFDEIVLSSRSEAENVVDRLFEIVSKYEVATVADLYDLVGLASTHIDHKWGWTDLRGSVVSRIRNQGYLLDLPEPEPLA